jgi:O-antigen/teichoic acid export membrane protein
MGVIQRQGIKSALLNYIGIAVGAASVLWVYPQALAEYGLITFMTEMAFILGAVGQGCVHVTMLRFFPTFRSDERGHFGLLTWTWFANLVGFIFFGLFFWLFYAQISGFYAQQKGFEPAHTKYIFIFAYLTGQMFLLSNYCAAFKRVVIGAFVDLVTRLARPALIIIYLLGWLDITQLIQSVLLAYLLCIVILIWYIRRMGQWYIKPINTVFNRSLLGEMGQYSLVTTMIISFSFLSLQLDRITVPAYMGFEQNGVYGIALFIANLVAVPMLSLSTISTPVVIEHFAAGRAEEVQKLYEKTGTILCLSGIFIFLGVMSNVDDLFRLTPRYELLKTGIWVVFTLSLGRVIEGLGGVSKVILEYSQAYKWTLLLMLLSMATNIALTWLLIPNYGLLGIAIAASVAVNIYTFGRVLLLYWLYDLLPLRWHLIWAFLWGAVVYLGLFWLPLPFSPIPNMLIRGVLVVVFYVPVVLWLRISPDINDFLLHAWLRLPWRRKQ